MFCGKIAFSYPLYVVCFFLNLLQMGKVNVWERFGVLTVELWKTRLDIVI